MSQYIFVYDHTVLKGNEDTDPDPTEAIRFFYPPTVDPQEQHELCSQLMGVVKLLQHLFKSRPTLFHLTNPLGSVEGETRKTGKSSSAGGKPSPRRSGGGVVACVHTPSGQYTFAYYTSNAQISPDCVMRHAETLYKLIVFYNGCLECLFGAPDTVGLQPVNNENPITLLSSSVARYLAYITSSGNTLLSIFEPLANHPINDSLLYQLVANLLDNCTGWPHVLGGCLFYRDRLVMSQLPLSIVSRISLIKQRHIESADKYAEFISRAIISSSEFQHNSNSQGLVLPPGVALLRCLLPQSETAELNNTTRQDNENLVTFTSTRSAATSSPPAIVRDHTITIDASLSPEVDPNMTPPRYNPTDDDIDPVMATQPCCNHAGFKSHLLYIEAKSDMFLALLLTDTPAVTQHSYLRDLHRLCFPAIGELELSLLRQSHDSCTSATNGVSSADRGGSVEADSSIPVGALVFDPIDRSLTVNLGNATGSDVDLVGGSEASVGKRMASPMTYWQEQLVGCAGSVHDEMIRDDSLRQVVLGGTTGWFSAKKRAGRELYEAREIKERDSLNYRNGRK